MHGSNVTGEVASTRKSEVKAPKLEVAKDPISSLKPEGFSCGPMSLVKYAEDVELKADTGFYVFLPPKSRRSKRRHPKLKSTVTKWMLLVQ